MQRGRIIVDWGTTNFRAYLFAANGDVAETRQAAAGIMAVTDGDFEAVLLREIGDWLGADVDVLLSGMITSRNGWVETPYAPTPATLADLKALAQARSGPRGARLLFLPGVASRAPRPDVMRGEEIQVFGSVAEGESAIVILPGTHSKWVRVEAGRLMEFRTFFTGELFALLRDHSIIGRLAGKGPATNSAFLGGVTSTQDGNSAGLLSDIFTVRAGVLLGQTPADDLVERLSGVIIGHEIAGGIGVFGRSLPIILVGDAALCQRYQTALSACGVAARPGPAMPTVEGFRKLASVAGAA